MQKEKIMGLQTRKINKRRSGAILAVVALFLAACSSTSSSSSSSPAEASKSSVVIGAPFPLSGAWAQEGQNSLDGMKVAAAAINAAGGLSGFHHDKIVIDAADTTSNNPGQAKTVASELISNDHAVALVGSYLSSLTLATVVAANDAHVPIITQSFVNQLTTSGYKWIFQIPPTASSFGSATISDLTKVYPNVKDISVLYGNDASDIAEGNSVTSDAKAAGLKVAGSVEFPDTLTSAAPIVSDVAGEHAQMIVLAGPLTTDNLIIKALVAGGIKLPILDPGGGGALDNQFATTLGQAANGVIALAAWSWNLPYPGAKIMEKDYYAQYHAHMPQESGESAAAVYEIADAINAAHSDSNTAIRSELLKTQFSDSTPAGAVYPGYVKFLSNGRSENQVPLMVQWQNGSLQTLYPKAVATAKPLSLG